MARIQMNKCFLDAYNDNEHRILFLLGGGSSGKSYFVFQREVLRAWQDKRKTLVLRKSATDLRRSCWEDLVSALKTCGYYPHCKINSTLLTVEMPNGSQFLCMGLDDPDKIKSIPNINDIVLEECSEATLEDFSQIKQRLRGAEGKFRNQILLMSNPVSKANWTYKHFFENGCQEPNCYISRTTYRDNSFVNEATVEALENYKTTNPYFYRVYCLGEFGSLSKQIITNYRSEELDVNELRGEGFTHLVGLDFGFVNDPTAIVESLLDEENNKLYVIREFYKTGLVNSEIANQLDLMGLSKSTIIADSAEQKSIEEIKRAGIRRIKPCAKGQGSINQGITKLQELEIIVNDSCFYILEEFENYSWKKDKTTGEYINTPIDQFNHCVDALRYSLQCVDTKHQLKVLPRGTL